VLAPVGAEVSGAEATPSSTPTPSTSRSEDGGRTVTLPVTEDVTEGKGSGAGRSVRQRGWQLAHWAVANASALHIQRVSYGGRVWTAGNTDSRWRATGTGSGSESGAGAVRILTAQ
jgi:hypothetical protein